MEEIKLKYPINIDGAEIKSLTMRRAKVKDRLAVEGKGLDEASKEVNLIANLCDISPDSLNDVDLSDYKHAQDVLASFLS